MRGPLAPSLALLALIAAAAARTVNDGGDGSAGVRSADIIEEVCKKATPAVWLLPYPGDCTKYIGCDVWGGTSTIYTCTPPLHFNPSVQGCDWPEYARCELGESGGDGGSITDASGNGDSDSVTSSGGGDPDSSSGGGDGSSSGDGDGDGSGDGDGEGSGGDSDGGDVGGESGVCKDATKDRLHLPYPGDCTKFYKCDLVSGKSKVITCPDGLHFNAQIQVCDWPWNAGCSNGDDDKSDPGNTSGPGPNKSSEGCGGDTGASSSDSKGCGKSSSSGRSSNSASSSSSSESQPCDKSKSSESKSCGDDRSRETKESNDCDGKDSDENNNIGSSNVCKYATPNRYHLPHPTDPTKFYKCDLNTGVAHEFDCPDGLVFNAEWQVCAFSIRGRLMPVHSSKTALK